MSESALKKPALNQKTCLTSSTSSTPTGLLGKKRAPRLEHKCALDVHFACLSLIASSLTAWLKKWTGAIAQVGQEVAQVCPMSISTSLIINATPDVDKFAQFLRWTHYQTFAQDMHAWKHKLCLDFFRQHNCHAFGCTSVRSVHSRALARCTKQTKRLCVDLL